MDELYFYIDKVKEKLDKNNVINSLIEERNKVFENKKLIELIECYHLEKSDKLRKEIYSYKEFISYKEKENEVNLLILNINKMLKDITGNRGCFK